MARAPQQTRIRNPYHIHTSIDDKVSFGGGSPKCHGDAFVGWDDAHNIDQLFLQFDKGADQVAQHDHIVCFFEELLLD